MTDSLSNEDMHALLAAWEAWDDAPTNRDRVVVYERELHRSAAALQCTSLNLRAGLVRHKAEGLTRAAALAAFRKGHAANASG